MGWTPSMLLSVVSVYHYGQEAFEKRIKIASVNKTWRKVSKVSYYVTVMYSNITWWGRSRWYKNVLSMSNHWCHVNSYTNSVLIECWAGNVLFLIKIKFWFYSHHLAGPVVILKSFFRSPEVAQHWSVPLGIPDVNPWMFTLCTTLDYIV